MFIFVRKENWLECSFVHLLSSYLTALNSRVFFLQITYISSMDSMLSGELIGPGWCPDKFCSKSADDWGGKQNLLDAA